jgi:hypothetical protein
VLVRTGATATDRGADKKADSWKHERADHSTNRGTEPGVGRRATGALSGVRREWQAAREEKTHQYSSHVAPLKTTRLRFGVQS